MSANKLVSSFLLILGVQIILIIGLSNCLTHIWGHLHPRAVHLYEINFKLRRDILDTLDNHNDAFVDIHFPEKGIRNKYIITMMMVSSESTTQSTNQLHEAETVVINGGIGLNYTIVRVQDLHSEMNINFAIFGIHPNSYIL